MGRARGAGELGGGEVSARTGEKLVIRLENAITAGENRLYPSAEAYRADLRAIAAQIAERFIEIPVDVNGELCRCGDEIHLTDEDERLMVCGYTVGEDGFVSLYCSKLKDGRRWFPTVMTFASEVEHVKPRTLEDVLREFTDAVFRWDAEGGTVAETDTWTEVARPYADEIRELMGGAE